MNISFGFLRFFFTLLSMIFMTIYTVSTPAGKTVGHVLLGLGIGFVFGIVLIGFETVFRRFNLRSFNITILGIFIGYLMGKALLLILSAILEISSISTVLQTHEIEIIKIGLFLFGVYLGTLMTFRSSDELYVSIPFIRLTQGTQKKKDLILDISVLSDPRIIDLATTGLMDHQLILPRFFVKELYAQAEIGDEHSRMRAKRALEVVKKLEAIPHLGMRYNDTDFTEIADTMGKLLRLARLINANILSSDLSKVQISKIEEVTVINLHALSNALKPLMSSGETIRIEIQRHGKEPRQGVGYLKDGTMVVVNGGGDYLGQVIDARVLSVKHTTSGRMIFCNAVNEWESSHFDHSDSTEP